jgi:Multicopper oxidase
MAVVRRDEPASRQLSREGRDAFPLFRPFGRTSLWGPTPTDSSKDGFHPETGATTAPISFQAQGMLDANELGWKDTVRVNPGEMVSIVVTFDGFTGRYMYHCHILEHEDHDMMRPFVVMPAAALAVMDTPDMFMPMSSDGEKQ